MRFYKYLHTQPSFPTNFISVQLQGHLIGMSLCLCLCVRVGEFSRKAESVYCSYQAVIT